MYEGDINSTRYIDERLIIVMSVIHADIRKVKEKNCHVILHVHEKQIRESMLRTIYIQKIHETYGNVTGNA